MLRAAGCGFGFMGLQSLIAEAARPPRPPIPRAKPPQFPARAKRVIFLFMHGGPRPSTPSIPSLTRSRRRQAAAHQAAADLRGGKTGGPDEVALEIQELRTRAASPSAISSPISASARTTSACPLHGGEGVDHGAALLQTFTGTFTFTRPSMGSWVLYGLGTENRNLPGYITIKPRSTAARRTGVPVSCPARFRARPSAMPACRLLRSRRSPSSI